MKVFLEILDKVKAYYMNNKKTVISTGLLLFSYGLYNEYSSHQKNSMHSSLENEDFECLRNRKKRQNICSNYIHEISYTMNLRFSNAVIEGSSDIKFKITKNEFNEDKQVILDFHGKISGNKIIVNGKELKLKGKTNEICIPWKYLEENKINEVHIDYYVTINEKAFIIINNNQNSSRANNKSNDEDYGKYNWILKPENIHYFTPCFYSSNDDCILNASITTYESDILCTNSVSIEKDKNFATNKNHSKIASSINNDKGIQNTTNENNDLKVLNEFEEASKNFISSDLFYIGKISNFVVACFSKKDFQIQFIRCPNNENNNNQNSNINVLNENDNTNQNEAINFEKNHNALEIFNIQESLSNDFYDNELETLESLNSEISNEDIEMISLIFNFYKETYLGNWNKDQKLKVYLIDSNNISNKPYTMTKRFSTNETEEDNNLFYIVNDRILFVDKSIFTSKKSLISQLNMIKNISYLM